MSYILIDRDLYRTSAVLRVNGADANSFLQGQFTQDINTAEDGAAYGLWLDQKGRVLADGHVIRRGENDYLVVSFSATADQLMARLQAYLIADEVELMDETGAWVGVLLWGDLADGFSAGSPAVSFRSRRAGESGRQWLAPREQLEAIRAELLARGAVERDFAAAELARLRQGIPAVPADIGPRDLPNEGGLDEVAISYTKGCYLGQEVMARLKNLGQVRRRLHLVRGAGDPPAAGTLLYQGERKAGEIRSSASDAPGFLAMAMLSLVNLDAGTPLASAPNGPAEISLLRRV